MKRRIALLNKQGMTLIEVMIALFLFLIIALALLQASIISVDYNALGSMRENAISIAEGRMNDARSLCFSSTCDDLNKAGKGIDNVSISGCPAGFPSVGFPVTRIIGNASVPFCTNQNVFFVSDDTRQIVERVDWSWKGVRYTHSISSIVRRL